MLRAAAKTVLLAVLVILGLTGLWVYFHRPSAAEQRIAELEQIRARLKAERRVAKILVLDQKTDARGVLRTTLLFVEYGRDGSMLLDSVRQFMVEGDKVHIDAEVIEFEDSFVEKGDPLRGQTIMLFIGAYGSRQAPDSGTPLDAPGVVPVFYRGVDPTADNFETNLWANFWTLFKDPQDRKKLGILHAFGEGVFGPFDPDHVYTITVQAHGSLVLTAEPIDPLYGKDLDILRQRGGS